MQEKLKENPLVSVIIPCYNHAEFVQECIKSIIDQDYKNIELIIIDDGSKDNSIEKIEEMICLCKQRFIRFEFRSRENKGLCETLNEAIDWCEGYYISSIASDDMWKINKISVQSEFLSKNRTISACCSNVDVIGVNRGTSFFEDRSKVKIYKFEDIFLFKYNLPAATLMFCPSRLTGEKLFKEKHLVEDFYLFLKMTSAGKKIACLPDALAFYRWHGGNSSNLHHRAHAADRLKILSEYSNHRFYKESISISILIEAIQVVKTSKIEGIFLMFESIKLNIKNIATLRFVKFLLNFLKIHNYGC